MRPAFLLPTFEPRPGKSETLDPALEKHLRALRLESDEEFVVLDGRGHLHTLKAGRAKSKLTFEFVKTESVKKPSVEIELCLSPPKGEALWEAIAQATELGVTRVQFLRSDHNQLPKAAKIPSPRAQRISDSACEQCHQAWRVEIASEWATLEELLDPPAQTLCIFADESWAAKNVYGFKNALKPGFSRYRLFIGPEGGWSHRERQILGARATGLGLGPLILRVPTACVAALYHLRLLVGSG